MGSKMLIDATHPEETRVVVLRGGRVEEFDYESAARELLRGNIYLAKVTRVEPSLQAAFVDYGGNRHGFLAFNEIHPDYYQIPMADRQALIDEEAQAEAEEEAAADARAEAVARRRKPHGQRGGNDRRQGRHGGESSRTAEAPEGGDDDRTAATGHDDIGADDAGRDHDDAGTEDIGLDERGRDASGRDEAGAEDLGHDADDRPGTTYAEDTGLVEVAVSELPPVEVGGFGQSDDRDDGHGEDGDDEGGERREGGDATVDASGGDDDGERDDNGVQEVSGGAETAEVEQVGTEDALDEFAARPRPRRRTRSYKIQEVIKRRQVILVQVVKEERGTKGAALTTYLSLAGRYTVLMPNTARGGGISRKINNPQDRKRLKAIAQELEVPEGMGLIIRTAGAARTSQEIKRDFEYLLRLWESVREMTLQSEAPSLVYEEGNLIKRSIRDLYNKDVDEIIVAGTEAHRDARDFMRMLMPSHAKNVIEYTAPEPLFTKFGIERQLNAMFSPYVTLRSGGYLVINQTEALVAVDVNSGKSTREFSIEETALNTNLEAADEIARQVKLRDLAGLIVIDFIDMEEKRNNRAVERRLKDALRFDRARIQLGRISHFGLMEMSRQRLRTGVLEGSTTQCPHCQGTGIIRSTESVALAVLRGLEDAVTAGARTPLIATTTPTVALYILNNKRAFIIDMESRLGMPVAVQGSDKLQGANYTIEKGAAPTTTPLRRTDRNAVNMDWGFDGDEEPSDAEADGDDAPSGEQARGETQRHARDERRPERADEERDGNGSEDGGRRRRRRRRRGGRRGDRFEGDAMRGSAQDAEVGDDRTDGDEGGGASGGDHISFAGDDDGDEPRIVEIGGSDGDDDTGSEADGDGSPEAHGGGEGEGEGRRRGRRRGRRGGRRNRDRGEGALAREPRAEARDSAADDEATTSEPDRGADGDVGEDDATSGRASEERREQPAAPARRSRHAERHGEKHGEDRREVRASNDTEPPASRAAAGTAERGAPEEPAAPRSRPAEQSRETVEPAAEMPRHRQRAMAEPGEPKLERVVVRPDASTETSPTGEAERPARKGWWSRRFGGE